MNEMIEPNIVPGDRPASGRVPCKNCYWLSSHRIFEQQCGSTLRRRYSQCGSTLRHRHCSTAAGFAMLELIVAAGLLATAVSLVATCAVAAQRIQRLQQQHTLAVDELSNQLERLTTLPPSDIDSALQQLQPSDWAVQRLPGASVTGKRMDDEWGERVELQVQWTRIGSPPPLVAVGWLRSEATQKDES